MGELEGVIETEVGETKKKIYFAVCHLCGYKLLKGTEGTQVEMMCPKCRDEVIVTISKEVVQTAKVRNKKK